MHGVKIRAFWCLRRIHTRLPQVVGMDHPAVALHQVKQIDHHIALGKCLPDADLHQVDTVPLTVVICFSKALLVKIG